VTGRVLTPEQADHALPPRRTRALRWMVRVILALIVLVFALWLVLFITKGRFLRPWFEKIASARVHRSVKVPGEFNLYFAPFNIAFRADGLRVGNPDWAQHSDLIDARHLALTVRTLPLVFGKTRIARADLDGANVSLQWDARHEHNNWTLDAANARPRPFEMPDIESGLITDTHIVYRDPRSQIAAAIDIHPLAAVHSHIASVLGFSGTGSLRQWPIRFSGRIENTDQALHAGSSQVALHAEGAATTIDLAGEMPGISNVTAGHYHLAVLGADMATLFDFMGVVGVPTRRYHLVTDVAHPDDDWVFTGIKGVFGDSDIAGRLAVGTRDDRLHLDGDLHTASLDLIDAAPLIGFDPARLDRMGTKGMITQEQGHPRILPDTPLRSKELRKFDADIRYRADVIANRNFPVEQIAVTLNLNHGVMRLKPVSAVVATGRMDGGFVLDARGAEVITDYQLRLHPTPMGKLLYRFGVEQAGTSGTMSARVAMRGVGNSVRESLGHANGRIVAIIPAGTMWARNIQLAELDIGTFITKMFQKKLKEPVSINCGLLGFTVRNGVSTADPLLIDTKKNIITGNGDFSFRDESINLNVKAKGKTFSLFSLQSPVGVGGYLAQPRLKVISPQLLTRVAAGGALAVVGTPIAAMLAFIDPGDGKAAACGPVLAGARADAQHTGKGKPIKGLKVQGH
jgi:uncharacterized protein involved in outer membrane biogenesis